MIFTIGVHGQTTESQKTLIVFDPLFWKDKLKLDAYQCKRIREINSQYYQRLLTSVKDERNSSTKKRKAAETLLQRSEEIWETFHPKQQKRWRRMWNDNASWWTILKKEKTIEHL
ncbi:MAG: hypothetical protein C0490_20390 [Marivirga sp.]|nr:hypothetical protein [Marivirga sp.]